MVLGYDILEEIDPTIPLPSKVQCKWYLRIVNEQITNNKCARPVRLKKGGGCKRENKMGAETTARACNRENND